ncbi:L,D-transpeptidase [Verrucomicrobiaceae bacterium N1E253]|uniref:L,D-transpeptidase n=1 Tax=Oceaniferula marina TaxID=2748318 RepID=A0A851GGG7_9BACT|nr:L,D-transpeptidase [Oceaniferula marina]NWK54921.1 L,D-transpeptidase [Oceaniferula marina]
MIRTTLFTIFLSSSLFAQAVPLVPATPTPGSTETTNPAKTPAKAVVIEEDPAASSSSKTDKASRTLSDSGITLPPKGEASVKLQIYLDQQHFGPGIIDGKPGTFTQKAIANYNLSKGREQTDTRVLKEAEEKVSVTYATAIVPSTVNDYVDTSLPYKRSLQAQRKAMHYRSIGEFMAERYHTSEDLLVELNSKKAVWGAQPGSVLKVPNIEPFLIENLKRGRSHKTTEELSARHVIVDTQIKQVLIYKLQLPNEQSNGDTVTVKAAQPKLIASFPITPGKTQFIPKGFWNLKNSYELIEWRYDQQMLDTGVRSKTGLAIPPGPNNPIGVVWNGLTKSGIGIHGTDNPRTIGRARSAGCIRLANWDAARFPNLVRPGAVVVIR